MSCENEPTSASALQMSAMRRSPPSARQCTYTARRSRSFKPRDPAERLVVYSSKRNGGGGGHGCCGVECCCPLVG